MIEEFNVVNITQSEVFLPSWCGGRWPSLALVWWWCRYDRASPLNTSIAQHWGGEVPLNTLKKALKMTLQEALLCVCTP